LLTPSAAQREVAMMTGTVKTFLAGRDGATPHPERKVGRMASGEKAFVTTSGV
jgi:hypothetical protein